jgi:hypothetical protein
MEKKMESYNNVKLFDTDFDRIFFTSHGQHLNLLGKKLISSELAIVINDLFVKKQPTPTCIPGKGILDETDPNQHIPDDVTPNIEISNILQSNDLEKLNTELSDRKNSKKITAPLNPPNDKQNRWLQRTQTFYGIR